MDTKRPGDQALVREINLSAILSRLHTQAPLSRAQLATLTGLNKSTVSSLVEELESLGLIYETGLNLPPTGRPGKLLELNPKAGLIIGLELGVDFILVILSNFTGEVQWRKKIEVDPLAGQDETIQKGLCLVDEAILQQRSMGGRLLGMGLTLPGMVDIDTGVLIFSPNLSWRNVPLGDIFEDHTGVPAYVDNDATAAAIGEHLFGDARNARHFIFLIVGVGVGGGMFLNGEIYRGADGYAGEIGHTMLSLDQNRPCRCGNQGCWENSGNQYSLIERVNARLHIGRRSIIPNLMETQQSPLTLSIITQAADAGDREALEALRETGAALGLGVANLINTFNPNLIILGGALSVASRYLIPAIQTMVKERALPELRRQTEVIVSAFGEEASVMGAVAMVVNAILSDPAQIRRLPVPDRKLAKEATRERR